MSRLVRQLLVASMLALYGSVSLVGAGLHALLEHGHSDSFDHPRHKPFGHLTGEASADHCPICQVHVQGQMPVGAIPLAYQPLAQFRSPVVPRLITSPRRHAPAHPRAPPVASASLS